MLMEEAEHWWDNACKRLENARTAITWSVFKVMFSGQYFNMKEWNLSAGECVSGRVRHQV
jgi:hypothetical protein